MMVYVVISCHNVSWGGYISLPSGVMWIFVDKLVWHTFTQIVVWTEIVLIGTMLVLQWKNFWCGKQFVYKDFHFFMILCEVFTGANFSFVAITSSVLIFSPPYIDKDRFLFYLKPVSFENWCYLSLWLAMNCFKSQIMPRIAVVWSHRFSFLTYESTSKNKWHNNHNNYYLRNK